MTTSGYNRTSIIAHWIAAALVISLFFTHEGERGSLAFAFHVGAGFIGGLFLIWRVFRRLARGMTDKPAQNWLLNLASQLVIWGFLINMVVITLTGIFVIWSLGQPIDIFGLFSVPSPMPAMRSLHEALEEVHEVSGQLFVPLVVLHVLGALKHAVIDRDGVMARMVSPVAGGR
ncbi:MAG: cytochrome b/b6 domain-containing protein [Rhizobiaceae bacterium]